MKTQLFCSRAGFLDKVDDPIFRVLMQQMDFLPLTIHHPQTKTLASALFTKNEKLPSFYLQKLKVACCVITGFRATALLSDKV